MNKAKAVLIFLVCGLAAGLCFSGLLSIPRLLTFWYIKGDKLLIPTYRYYLGVGLFLWLGMASAFLICRVMRLTRRPPGNAIFRQTLSGLVVATSAVTVFAIARRFTTGDPVMIYLLSIAAFVLLNSFACWILTARLYYVGFVLNLLALPLALALLVVAAKTVHIPSEWAELIPFPIYFSSLAAACGFWIASGESSRS